MNSPERTDSLALPVEGPYRVRLHARGRSEGEEAQHITASNGDLLVEQHMIQIWPAPIFEDMWLKEAE